MLQTQLVGAALPADGATRSHPARENARADAPFRGHVAPSLAPEPPGTRAAARPGGRGVSLRRRCFLPSPKMNQRNQPPAVLPVKQGECCKGIDPWETGMNSLFTLGRKAQ